MADEAKIRISGDTKDLSEALKGAEGMLQRFGNFIKNNEFLQARIFEGMVQGLLHFLRSGMQAFEDDERALAKLEQTLKSTGNAAGYSSGQIDKLGRAIAEMAGADGDAVQDMLTALLQFENIKGTALRDTAIMATDLAAALNMELVPAADMLGKALNDPAKAAMTLSRLGIVLNQDTQDLIDTMIAAGNVMGAQELILERLGKQYGGQAAVKLETFAGQWELLKYKFEDAGGAVVKTFIPAMIAGIDALNGAVWVFQECWKVVDAFIGQLAKLNFYVTGDWSATWTNVWANFAGAIGGIVYIIEHLGDAFVMEFLAAELAVWKTINTMIYFFEEVIPPYLTWFGNNWTRVFYDSFNAITTALGNLLSNFAEFFDTIKNWLAGGKDEFLFKGLLDGFEATVDKLPEIAKRVETAHERSLRMTLHDMLVDYGKGLSDAFTSAKLDYLKQFGPEKGTGPLPAPDMAYGGYSVTDPINDKEDKKKKKKEKEEKDFQSSLVGLEELQRKIQTGAASEHKRELEEQRKHAEELADEEQKAVEEQTAQLVKSQGATTAAVQMVVTKLSNLNTGLT